MIITDSSLSPSKRFIEILNKYFTSIDYTYNKTHKCFEKINEDRIEKIHMSFLKWGSIVSAEVVWSLTLPKIEIVIKKMKNIKKRGFDETMIISMTNYQEAKQKETVKIIDLYDEQTGKSDDYLLNKSANNFIDIYKKYIELFYKKFDCLEKIEVELNKIPIEKTQYMTIEKQITVGLILTKLLHPENVDEVIKSYKLFLLNSKYSDKEFFIKHLENMVATLNTDKINEMLINTQISCKRN